MNKKNTKKTNKTNEAQELLIWRSWVTFSIALIITVIAGFFIHAHTVFFVETIPVFHALFGFGSCAIIVILSKLLGIILKKPEDYYGEQK